MRKEYISMILGNHQSVVENDIGNAAVISVQSEDIDINITVPFEKNEVVWQAMDNNGELLVQDIHNFADDNEYEDFKECLLDIHDFLKAPKCRLSSNGKAIEAYSFKWYFLFGEFKGNDSAR